jgi:outer membrane protein assembly factor BamB
MMTIPRKLAPRQLIVRCVSIAICLGTATIALADFTNWPEYRGPEGNGHANSAQLAWQWDEHQNICWKTPIHDRGWSSPVIWDQQVWLTTATQDGKRMYAVCVDRESGKMVHDLHLFDVEAPREIHITNSYASPTPAIEAGRVYVHFGSYGTACLDTQSGKVLWQRRDFPCHHWRGPGSSPILFEDLLILHFDGYDFQYVVALDKRTGQTRWRVDRDIDYETDDGDLKKGFCTPTVIQVDGQLQLISPAAKAAIAYDPHSGEEIWRIRYPNHSAAARPLFGHGLVFINTGFSRAQLFAVRPTGRGDVTDSHVKWFVDRGIGSKPSHLLVGDLIYNIHDRGTASCLEALTGKVIWQERLGGSFSASPLLAGDRIYFFDEEGTTTVIRTGRSFERLAENRLDDGCMASPAVSGDALFLRTKSHLYRIESPDRRDQN